jgi:hypothetical protein
MERLKTFYCWIKLSPRKPAKDTKAAKDTAAAAWRAAAVVLLEASRSEQVAPADMASLVQAFRNGPRPPKNGPRPPGRYGGSMMSGWWKLDDYYIGNPASDLIVSYEPVPGDREDAEAWLDTQEGRDWQVDATTFFLMHFNAVVDL